jgi:hypothetical protein
MTFRELCFSCTNLVSCADVRVFDGGKATCNVKMQSLAREVDWFTVTGLNSVDVELYSEDE